MTETIAVGEPPDRHRRWRGAVWVANSLERHRLAHRPGVEPGRGDDRRSARPRRTSTVAHDRVWVSVQAERRPAEPPAAAASEDVAQGADLQIPGSIDPALTAVRRLQRAGADLRAALQLPGPPVPDGARLAARGRRRTSLGLRRRRIYTFELRDDFRFSPPSNEPVTAAAFERAIERGLSPEMGSYGGRSSRKTSSAPRSIASGEAPDLAGVVARARR